MLELRVLSVGSTEGTEPSCESGFTTDSIGGFMQLHADGCERFLLQGAVRSGTAGVGTEPCSLRTSRTGDRFGFEDVLVII